MVSPLRVQLWVPGQESVLPDLKDQLSYTYEPQYSNPTIHPGLLDRCVTHEGLQLADAA